MTEQPPSAPETPTEPAAASTPPPGAAPARSEPSGATIPLDADDTRGQHFRHMFSGPGPLIATVLFVAAAGVAGAVLVGPGVGAAAGGGALLLLLVIAWVVASARAESDFFRSYAEGHSLRLEMGRGNLPPATPLLRRGDRRYTKCKLSGSLPGGQDGALALYTYEDTDTDSEGNRHTTYMHFTVIYAEVPEVAPFMEELFAQRRVGFRFLDGAEDIFRKRQRVEHESEVVDKRYEVFCGANDDMNRARQILSPSFLAWLQDHSPEAFAFECVAGALVCNVKGHKKSKPELDSLCEGASAVARRLREEALE